MILLEFNEGGTNIALNFTDISLICGSCQEGRTVIMMNSGKEIVVNKSYQEILKEITSFGAKKVPIDKMAEK